MNREPRSKPSVSWGKAILAVFFELVGVQILGFIAAIALLCGVIWAGQRRWGVILLLLGILTVLGFVTKALCKWPIWKSARPTWQKCFFGTLLFGPLSIFIVIAIGAMIAALQSSLHFP